MLVLTRRTLERIIITSPDGQKLGEVVVLLAERNFVKIGLDFPVEYRIIRADPSPGYQRECPRCKSIDITISGTGVMCNHCRSWFRL